MRKLVLAAVLAALALPAVPALAQEGPTAEERAEKRDKENLDSQYKNALKAMQGKESAAKNDPWAAMRAPSAPPPAPKR